MAISYQNYEENAKSHGNFIGILRNYPGQSIIYCVFDFYCLYILNYNVNEKYSATVLTRNLCENNKHYQQLKKKNLFIFKIYIGI